MPDTPDQSLEDAGTDRASEKKISPQYLSIAIAGLAVVISGANWWFTAVSGVKTETLASQAASLQRNDECRNLRDEILKFHKAGISDIVIRRTYENEPAKREPVAANKPKGTLLDDYNRDCGSVTRTISLIGQAKVESVSSG